MDNQNPIEPGDIAIYNKQPPRVFYRLTWKIHSSGPGMIQLKLPLKSARWMCLKGGDTGIPVKLKIQVNIAKKNKVQGRQWCKRTLHFLIYHSKVQGRTVPTWRA